MLLNCTITSLSADHFELTMRRYISMYLCFRENFGTMSQGEKIRSVSKLLEQLVDAVSTLSKISNWSPNIFCVSFESKIQLYKIHASINQPRPFQNSACHFI